MKVAIIGSRDFNDYGQVAFHIRRLQDGGVTVEEIVSGGARGADALGKKCALENNLKYTEFPADWDKHGKAAGFIRNEEIVKYSDFIIAFWDGVSKGTANSINLARRYKKDTMIVYF